jgi:hypothetical protein
MPGAGKPFTKGNGGGPGRPKIPNEFKEMCRQFSPQVFAKWKQEVEQGGDNWLKAGELIVAYGHGKPTQPLGNDDEGGRLEVVVRTVADEG